MPVERNELSLRRSFSIAINFVCVSLHTLGVGVALLMPKSLSFSEQKAKSTSIPRRKNVNENEMYGKRDAILEASAIA